MSWRRYAAPLPIERRRSRWLAAFLAVSHGGALGLLAALPVGAMTVVLAAAVVASLRYSLHRHVGRGSVTHLCWEEAGGAWRLATGGGAGEPWQLQPSSYVHPRCLVLNFRRGRRRRSVVLLPDSADRETLRRLRVRLRLEGAGAGDG